MRVLPKDLLSFEPTRFFAFTQNDNFHYEQNH